MLILTQILLSPMMDALVDLLLDNGRLFRDHSVALAFAFTVI
jgi:hypothetical protein